MFDAYRTQIEVYLAKLSIPSPWGISLFDNITVIAGGLSLLFFLLFAMSSRAPKTRDEDERPVRVLVKKAKKAEKKENFKEAGELYLAARHYMKAAKVFVQIEGLRVLDIAPGGRVARSLLAAQARGEDPERGAEPGVRGSALL